MAKAMVESGYTPENDIVFCLHGAEEWGTSVEVGWEELAGGAEEDAG